jgi:RimJ/RimL family protein N-acetyltransferase
VEKRGSSLEPEANAILDALGLTLRPLAEGDAAALSAFHGGLSETSRHFFEPYRDRSVQAMANVIWRSRHLDEDHHVLADGGGRIVAHVFIGDLYADPPHIGIGIADDYQGRGLGDVLLRFILARADEIVVGSTIGLTVLKANERAIGLYERHGFSICGEATFRTPSDSHVMRRPLRASS